jgi:hypothetical protein
MAKDERGKYQIGPSTIPPKSWTERELHRLEKKKAEVSQVFHIEEIAKEAKEIAISAKEKKVNHECNQADRLSKMERGIDSWTKWFRGAIITFFGLVLTAGVTLFVRFSDLQSEIAETSKEAEEIRESISGLEETQKDLWNEMNQRDGSRGDNKEILNEMREILRQLATQKGSR